MRRHLEIAHPSFHPESPLQIFPSGVSQELRSESLRLYLPGFPTGLIILLDSLLVLCRRQSESVIPRLPLHRGLARPPHPLWSAMALSFLDRKSAPGGFSALARDELPHL